jgi:cytochrome P450
MSSTEQESRAREGAPGIDEAMAQPAFRDDPYPLYARMRREDPVHRAERGGWILSRYDDVERVLHDPARFSNDSERFEAVRRWAEGREEPEPLASVFGRSMVSTDPPEHTRLRGIASRAFTPLRIRLRPAIETIVGELLNEASDGELDLIEDFAAPLPVTVICELMGVPREDRASVRRWSRELVDREGGSLEPDPAELDALAELARPLTDYLRGLVEERRARPGEDFVSRLLAAQDPAQPLDESELVGTCLVLLIAGHETTMNLIGNGTLALLRNRGEWERLVRDPELAKRAVEELLRYDSPAQFIGRAVVDDVELAGRTLRRGDTVIGAIGSANRDPDHFPDPDRLDVGRGDRSHLSFGAGVHFCFGAPLARMEGEVAFRALAERAPGLRLLEDAPRWRPNPGLRGLEGLRVGL